MAKNLHLEHPEDMVLTGNLDVVKWFYANSTTSVKIDGAPAIVFGTNPENGKFFVGTKSVFNKKKIKICYTYGDIVAMYDNPKLVGILGSCLQYLPRIKGVIQGDFIGFGGEDLYTPNTITYKFPEVVTQKIIFAPHTVYKGDSLKEMDASPLLKTLESDDAVLFVQPTVDVIPQHSNFDDLEDAAKRCEEFLTDKEAAEVKVIFNQFIRAGMDITYPIAFEVIGDPNLALLYVLIMRQKYDLMSNHIVYDGPEAFIDDQNIYAEGFVRHNQFGSYKLVDRMLFSAANFNNTKFRSN